MSFFTEEGQALPLEEVHLDSPCTGILAGHGREPKAVDALVVAGRGAVFRRGDAQVVSEVVLDEKVHVQAGHVEQLAHQALRQRLSVAELVGNVDAVGGQEDAT